MTNSFGARIMPRAKRIKFNDHIRIEVGPEDQKETFVTNGDLLTTRSLFFKKALFGEWKEAHDRMVKLPDNDAGVFALYMHFVHTNELAVGTNRVPQDADVGYEQFALMQIYVLAEQLQDIKTKNAVLKAILHGTNKKREHDGCRYYPGEEAINILYKGTPPGSPARKLLVDMYVSYDVPEWKPTDAEWHGEFIREIAVELLNRKTRQKASYECVEDFKPYLEEEI
ncbi:hypothetical protein N0V94_006970 [Neodidymelliopsis sp. IMI 364377]|nr:hypothetical protein N0V94_006970 [Neodidymelliopsis sp. IMI 364377]